MVNYLLIDGSYYIFYRFHALKKYWDFRDDKPPLGDDPFSNIDFKEQYIKVFITKINEIKKKLKLKDCKILIAKDCPRNNIWRNDFIKEYKSNREITKGIGDFFKIVYEDDLFIKAGAECILEYPRLEADDCIALFVKNLKEKESNITIITNDADYLQLQNENVNIIALNYKNLNASKNSFKDPKKDLFCKIVKGDKSDNIPGIFKKCGIKTCEKLYDDNELFLEKLEKENATELYQLNNLIIDFDNIPLELSSKFLKKYENLIGIDSDNDSENKNIEK